LQTKLEPYRCDTHDPNYGFVINKDTLALDNEVFAILKKALDLIRTANVPDQNEVVMTMLNATFSNVLIEQGFAVFPTEEEAAVIRAIAPFVDLVFVAGSLSEAGQRNVRVWIHREFRGSTGVPTVHFVYPARL
jgi:hypothetical protein